MEGLRTALELLFGFIIVIILAYLTTLLVGNKAGNLGKSKYMKIIDKIVLGKNQTLCIIQIGKRYFLIGLTSNGIEYLVDIDEKSLISIENKDQVPFQNIFDKYKVNFKMPNKVTELFNINSKGCKDNSRKDKDIENE